MSQLHRARPIRLAFSALFWRLMVGMTTLMALGLVSVLVRRVPPPQWLIGFLFFMPGLAAVAFAVAAGLTVVADLTVRLIVRPRILSWQSPRVDESHSSFHIDARERIDAESPARMGLGRAWAAGRLVLTDRRLLFVPNEWDVERWASPVDRLVVTRTVEHPRMFLGLIRGLPPRLKVVADGQPTRIFAVDDAVAWSSIASPARPNPDPDPARSR